MYIPWKGSPVVSAVTWESISHFYHFWYKCFSEITQSLSSLPTSQSNWWFCINFNKHTRHNLLHSNVYITALPHFIFDSSALSTRNSFHIYASVVYIPSGHYFCQKLLKTNTACSSTAKIREMFFYGKSAVYISRHIRECQNLILQCCVESGAESVNIVYRLCAIGKTVL